MRAMGKVFGLVVVLVLTGILTFAQEPLAAINGEPILQQDLAVSPEERKLHQQIYELRVKALTSRIASKLIEKEAERRGVTVRELISSEVNPKIGAPTNKEITDYYNQQKDRIDRPLKEVRDQIVELLRRSKAQTHLQDLVDRLQNEAEVEVFMDPPRLPVDLADARVRGPKNAAVTIVEFSDFQCPFCRRVQPVLAELSEQYEGRVRWAFKDLPLTDIHPEAMRAAQVARCAGDQGKFWEYRAKLFEQELFTDAVYTEIATELKLKPEPMLECADSAKYEQSVNREAREARNLGLDGTPAILVNGILLTGARPVEFYQRVIDRELKLAEKANP